jgi:hypothetical protein|tara:strand:- start:834 stop:1235 length:402 start_codon:yes stop_codon:yes gene_type:complete
MNTDTATYKVLKLLNGEELICELEDGVVDDSYEITNPLKMQVESKLTRQGPVESLSLSRWIGPYTEQSLFSIKTAHVLIVAEASEGLSRYYEHVRKEIIKRDSPDYRKSLNDIDNEEVYEDLLAELEIEDTIH